MKLMNSLFLVAVFFCAPIASAQEIDRREIEASAMAVLDEFIRSFSAMDAKAHIATYHFPHYRLARGVMNVTETAEEGVRQHQQLFKKLPDTGWFKSVWVDREVTNISETKVHVKTRFRRLREDGSEIGTYNSLYILQKIKGRWGVKMRSSFL
ncbi:MAG: hypothetical protein V7459_08085 [Oceanicoccus sp.]